MRAALNAFLIGIVVVCSASPAEAQGGGGQQAPQTIAARTAGLTRADGYIPFYWDQARGRLLFEISRFDQDLLYFTASSKAIGSVELGVDRGSGGGSAVIRFRQSGPRVLVIQQNLRFRAPSGSAAAKQVMEDSYAASVLASLPVEAQEDGRVLVDATSARDSRRRQSRRHAATEESGHLPARSVAQPRQPREDKGVPQEHRRRRLAHLRLRRAWTRRQPRGAGWTVAHLRHAPLVRRTAGRGLQAAKGRSAHGGRRPLVRRPVEVVLRSSRGTLGASLPVGEAQSRRGGERSGDADRLLRRPGHPRAVQDRFEGRHPVVEQGVRGRRIQQRHPRRSIPGRKSIRSTPVTPICSGPTATSAGSPTAVPSPTPAPEKSCRRSRAWTRIAFAPSATTGTPIVQR